MDEDYDDGRYDVDDVYDDERYDLANDMYYDPQNEQQHGNQFIIQFSCIITFFLYMFGKFLFASCKRLTTHFNRAFRRSQTFRFMILLIKLCFV